RAAHGCRCCLSCCSPAPVLCVRRTKRFYGRVVRPRSCLEKKPFAGIMRLPPVPHEAVGYFLGFIGGVAPHPCRVVDLYSAMHGEGMCGDHFLQWSDTSSTGSGTEEWWLRASSDT
ncbi:retrotransposon hot spot protein (RHS), partial [Trypanosoma cruzi]